MRWTAALDFDSDSARQRRSFSESTLAY